MKAIRTLPLPLPEDLVNTIAETAAKENCTPAELIREALGRYEEHGQLTSAIASGQNRLDALDDFLMENVNRIIHEYRAEKRAPAGAQKPKRCQISKIANYSEDHRWR
jgi:hypothetical protein